MKIAAHLHTYQGIQLLDDKTGFFYFVRNCQTVFHSEWLHHLAFLPAMRWTRDFVAPGPHPCFGFCASIRPALMGLCLICNFLVIGPFSIFPCAYLSSVCLLWRECVQIFCPLPSGVLWVLSVLCVFWIWVLYQICILLIFSLSLWLGFSFSWQCLSQSRRF